MNFRECVRLQTGKMTPYREWKWARILQPRNSRRINRWKAKLLDVGLHRRASL